MKSIFNIDGKIVSENEAVISLSSRIYRYGDGFFESMKFSDGQLLHNVLHWDRIKKSALLLNMTLPENLNRDEIIRRVEKTAELSLHKNARIRCTFLRNSEGFYTPSGSETTVIIEVQPQNDAEYHYNEIGLKLGAYREMTKNSNYTSTLKTTSALIYVMAGLYAREFNFDECVIFNDHDRVSECISANIFIVSGEFILTPPLSEYCIDGVMRKVVINLASGYGYTVIEQPISEITLTAADEVFLTNASLGIRWVGHYKGKHYRNTVSHILSTRLNPTEG